MTIVRVKGSNKIIDVTDERAEYLISQYGYELVEVINPLDDLDDVKDALGKKVKSDNIKEIRELANTFEYSLDGIIWKQVQGGGGGSTEPNVKILTDYVSYKSGSNWNPAFTQVFSDLTALGGGILKIPAGTYQINGLITIPSNIHVLGAGTGVTTIRLANGTNTDMITLDTNDNCGIRDLTIRGNCFDVSPSVNKDGLVIGRPGINTTNNEGVMYNTLIQNIEIRDIGGNGFHCYPGTWIYFLSRITIEFCTGYGAWIASTDNLYDTFNITANGKAGLYVTGSNNRLSNMKIIFNGRGPLSAGKFYGNGTDIDSAGVYCTGSRNTFINIDSQENYGHGYVFDGARDADLLGCLADKNGYKALAPDGTSITGTPTAVGLYFMNSCARLTGLIRATNFNTGLVSQPTGYYIDQTCADLSFDYEQDTTQGINTNLSLSSIVVTAVMKIIAHINTQYSDFIESGLSLVNAITATDTANFALTTSFVTAGYTISGNDIYCSTAWGQSTPRLGTANKAIVQNNVYLVRVKVKPDINNYFLRFKGIYNDGAFENLRQIDGNYSNVVYTDISFVLKAPRNGNLLVMIEDKVGANNAVQGPFHAAEFAIIDITNMISKWMPKAIDKVVKKNYFLGSRTFT